MNITEYILAFLAFASMFVMGATGFAMFGRNNTATSTPLQHVPPANYNDTAMQDLSIDYAGENVATFSNSMTNTIEELEPIAGESAMEAYLAELEEDEIISRIVKGDIPLSEHRLWNDISAPLKYLHRMKMHDYDACVINSRKVISMLEDTQSVEYGEALADIFEAQIYLDAFMAKYENRKDKTMEIFEVDEDFKYKLLETRNICRAKYVKIKELAYRMWYRIVKKDLESEAPFKLKYPGVEDSEKVKCINSQRDEDVTISSHNMCFVKKIENLAYAYHHLMFNVEEKMKYHYLDYEMQKFYGLIVNAIHYRLRVHEKYLLDIGFENDVLISEDEILGEDYGEDE